MLNVKEEERKCNFSKEQKPHLSFILYPQTCTVVCVCIKEKTIRAQKTPANKL